MKQEKFSEMCRSLGIKAKWLSDKAGVPLSVAEEWIEGREIASTAVIELLHTYERTERIASQGSQLTGSAKEAPKRRATAAQTSRKGKKTGKLEPAEERAGSAAQMEPVSGAEFKALRVSFGLSVECAAFINRVSVDTVKKWESGQIGVDGRGAYALRVMDDFIDSIADNYFAEVSQMAEINGSDFKNMRIVLPVFCSDHSYWLFNPGKEPLPVNSFNLGLERAAKKLTEAGCQVRTVKIELKDYLASLVGKDDTESSRNAWLQRMIETHFVPDEKKPPRQAKRKSPRPAKAAKRN